MLEKLQPGVLAMRSSNTGCGTSPGKIRVLSVSKAGRCGRYEELSIQPFDIGQRDTEFGVCPWVSDLLWSSGSLICFCSSLVLW